jgi:hypothetical protein
VTVQSKVKEVDPRLRDQLTEISKQNDQIFTKTKAGTVGRPWQVGSLGNWNGDPLDIDSLGKAFDRSKAGALYAAVYDPKGNASVGDAKALRIQIDRLISMERATRTRYSTAVRCELAAAGRRGRHGAGGYLTAVTLKYLQDLPIYPTTPNG